VVELNKQDLLYGYKRGKLDFCEYRVYDKQCSVKFSMTIQCTKGIVDYFYFDLWGLSPIMLKGGAQYLLTFINDYSRKVWVYFLEKKKSNVFVTFKQWKTMIKKRTSKKIKRLRTDNGLKFFSYEFHEFCKNEGIFRHCTIINTSKQNRVLKCINRTLLEKKHIVCFHKLKCQKTFKLKQLTWLVI
jgi:transposase InsO family protein